MHILKKIQKKNYLPTFVLVSSPYPETYFTKSVLNDKTRQHSECTSLSGNKLKRARQYKLNWVHLKGIDPLNGSKRDDKRNSAFGTDNFLYSALSIEVRTDIWSSQGMNPAGRSWNSEVEDR